MERWLPITGIITILTGVVGYALLPVTGMRNSPSLIVVVFWMLLMGALALCYLVAMSAFQVAKGRPIADIRSRLDKRRVGIFYLGCFIIGLNLTFFGMIKPELGQLRSFTADPALANLDHRIFGADPWTLLTWFNRPALVPLYHEGWFLWLALVLFHVLLREPSSEKDALLVSYVAIWSIFGPAVHLMMPAAGPIFYQSLGHGDRFAALHQTAQTRILTTYLWQGYIGKAFNAGGGISAMPSVHIATMFWTVIALRRTRMLTIAILYTAYIYAGSIAIGWHYFVDGIAGGVGAFICYGAASRLLRSGHSMPRLREPIASSLIS